jgi:alkylhydroperoxidase family enzyme
LAKQYGASDEKVEALLSFESSPLFSEPEKVALRVAEQTRDSGLGLDGALYEDLARHYHTVQILEIIAVCTAFQFFNRFVDALRIPPTPSAPDAA